MELWATVLGFNGVLYLRSIGEVILSRFPIPENMVEVILFFELAVYSLLKLWSLLGYFGETWKLGETYL